MLFLEKLNEMEIKNKELYNAHYFLWWYLHEKEFLYLSKITKKDEHNKNMLFFDINLFESELQELLDLLEKKNNRLELNNNTENFTQLKSSINLLIEVCKETLKNSNKNKLLNKIKTEIIQFYNNILNNSNAVYGDQNNNNFRKILTNPSFNSITRKRFSEIALGSPLNSNNI